MQAVHKTRDDSAGYYTTRAISETDAGFAAASDLTRCRRRQRERC